MIRRFALACAIALLFLLPKAAPSEEPNAPASIDLAARHDFRFFGADAEDEAGVQTRFGDLDGDGLDDVILGAWYADGRNNGKLRSGEVYVYYGRSSEKKGDLLTDVTVIYGAVAGERLGSSADVGDFDGDGRSDLLLGARYADGPADSLRPRAGEAFLLLGASDGGKKEVVDLRSRPDLVIFGRQEGDRLGRRILVADLDEDGKDDLVLGAIGSAGNTGEIRDAGAVYIVYGGKREDGGAVIDLSLGDVPALHGADDSDGLGSALAAGDWNGDGDLDLFLGCGFADGPSNGRTNAGETFVLFGVHGARFEGERVVTEGTDFTIYGADAYDAAGVAVAAGDFDGDGIDDLAIGANLADGPGEANDNCGEVYLLFGSRTVLPGAMMDLSLEKDLTISGAAKGDQLGSILGLFDWNEDGFDDLVCAALQSDGPGGGRIDAGMIYAFLGRRQSDLRPAIDLVAESGAADLRMLGPSSGDKVATLLEHGRVDGRPALIAGTMLGDGPGDSRRDAGEIYLLHWQPGKR
jgi:hypothetical protein